MPGSGWPFEIVAQTPSLSTYPTISRICVEQEHIWNFVSMLLCMHVLYNIFIIGGANQAGFKNFRAHR